LFRGSNRRLLRDGERHTQEKQQERRKAARHHATVNPSSHRTQAHAAL
jgi:hypothetical protein